MFLKRNKILKKYEIKKGFTIMGRLQINFYFIFLMGEKKVKKSNQYFTFLIFREKILHLKHYSAL